MSDEADDFKELLAFVADGGSLSREQAEGAFPRELFPPPRE